MVGTSLLEALIHTIFSVPHKEWTVEDLEVVKQNLVEAVQLKGLNKVTEIAVSDLLETIEVLKSWDGPEPRKCMEMVNQVLQKIKKSQNTVQVSVSVPTVSI